MSILDAFAKRVITSEVLWILAGDFNMQPSELEECPWIQAVGGA